VIVKAASEISNIGLVVVVVSDWSAKVEGPIEDKHVSTRLFDLELTLFEEFL